MEIGVLTSMPPEIFFRTQAAACPLLRPAARFFFDEKISWAAAAKEGAAITSQEELGHFGGGRGVDWAVHADYAAEGRYGITFQRAQIGFG